MISDENTRNRILKRIASGCRLVSGNLPYAYGVYRLINPITGVSEGVDEAIVNRMIHFDRLLKTTHETGGERIGDFEIFEELVSP